MRQRSLHQCGMSLYCLVLVRCEAEDNIQSTYHSDAHRFCCCSHLEHLPHLFFGMTCLADLQKRDSEEEWSRPEGICMLQCQSQLELRQSSTEKGKLPDYRKKISMYPNRKLQLKRPRQLIGIDIEALDGQWCTKARRSSSRLVSRESLTSEDVLCAPQSGDLIADQHSQFGVTSILSVILVCCWGGRVARERKMGQLVKQALEQWKTGRE